MFSELEIAQDCTWGGSIRTSLLIYLVLYCFLDVDPSDHASLHTTILASKTFLVVSVEHGKHEVLHDLGCELRRNILD